MRCIITSYRAKVSCTKVTYVNLTINLSDFIIEMTSSTQDTKVY